MKFNYFFLLHIVFVSTILTSCNKDKVIDPIPTISSDSNYISKILDVEKSGTQLDTFVRMFAYDHLKRVVEIKDNLLNAPSYKQLIKFIYNGNGPLPFERINARIGNNKSDSTTSFLYYDLSGNLIKDSSIFSVGDINTNSPTLIEKQLTNYTYNTNKIFANTANTLLFDASGTYIPSTVKDTSTIDVNKNIIEKKAKKTFSGTPTQTSQYLGTFTYDNYPSPYAVLNILNIFPNTNSLNEQYPLYNLQGSKNVRLISNESELGSNGSNKSSNNDFTNKYTFKANSFPLSILISRTPSTDYSKLIFVYTTL